MQKEGLDQNAGHSHLEDALPRALGSKQGVLTTVWGSRMHPTPAERLQRTTTCSFTVLLNPNAHS